MDNGLPIWGLQYQSYRKIKKFQYKAGFSTIVNKTEISNENCFSFERMDTNDFPQ